jgi:myo-inositol-1(or 4)-monophosphatase
MAMTQDLLAATTTAVQAAGAHLLRRYRAETHLLTRADVVTAIHDGDRESLSVMRAPLEQAYPAARWVDDELEDGALPAGPWWVVDPIEGAINYVHGLTDWGITATLVRDNRPELTVVHLPLAGVTYTAVDGGGAFRDGLRLHASVKTELAGALVGTGQASPRETSETFQRIGRSLVAMMAASGVTRVSVPPTLQLTHVADGRMDVFWQHSAVRSGLLAGTLLVQEAGGIVSDLHGKPWTPHSRDFLAAAPHLHSQAVNVLAPLS